MKRIFKIFVLIISIFAVSTLNVYAYDEYNYLKTTEIEELSNVKANNILLYNLNDNKILYRKNNDDRISVASLTKIMTALVVIEKYSDLNEKIKITSGAFYNTNGYAKAGFKIGDEVTILDLLYGVLLPSGADAAQQLAIQISGSIDAFSLEMNKKAVELGMNNTHYSNPVGRDNEQNYSTLDDISKLLFYALNNETFYKIYTSRNYTTTNNIELKSTLVPAKEKFNLNIDNIIGSKSGYTPDAGLCLSSIAEYNGIKYLLIIASSPYADGFPNHVLDSINIYDYYSKNYSYKNILSKNQNLVNLNVEDAYINNYEVKSDIDYSLYMKASMIDEIEYKYTGITTLDYKINKNDKLGKIDILYKDKLLYSYDIYLNEEIKYKHTKLIIFIITVIASLISIIMLILMRKRHKTKRNIKIKNLENTIY